MPYSCLKQTLYLLSCGCLIFYAVQAHAQLPTAPRSAAIATAHPLATAAAVETLKQGGNAFDAAVTAAATLAVVEPYSSGVGGGGFWLLYDASKNKTTMLDAREKAPLAAHADLYLDSKGQVINNASVNGPLAAGIPGIPAGLVHLANHYGRLTLARTLAPAIRIARKGFAVNTLYQSMARLRLDALQASSVASQIFLMNNEVPTIGHRIIQHDLAQTLEYIATKGAAGFYQGVIADRLVSSVRDAGGIWSKADLEQYRVVEREPIRINYHGTKITSASLPSSGGVVLGIILNTLAQLDKQWTNKAEEIHYTVEAMRRAYRDRAEYLGDIDFVQVPFKKLLSTNYAHSLATDIKPEKATPSASLARFNQSDIPESDNTTHYSIIDIEGNRVAATLSINYGFGSGFVVPGTGVLLNNEMDDFVAKPGVPNLYGLIGAQANEIASGKRMLSSMSPTFINDGKRLGIIGTPGGSRIITMVLIGILQFINGKTASQIVSTPRYHHQYLPDEISFEANAFSAQIQQRLKAIGHHLKQYGSTYGNMQLVIWDYQHNQLDAASDPRGIGQAWVGNTRISQ